MLHQSAVCSQASMLIFSFLSSW
ncbi:hypothetical protein CGRA01v4_10497 [Colletotrichum graminicola]|nr:hypothetical protein CGRA01v4_10497 [Colletotrichum graminicola]